MPLLKELRFSLPEDHNKDFDDSVRQLIPDVAQFYGMKVTGSSHWTYRLTASGKRVDEIVLALGRIGVTPDALKDAADVKLQAVIGLELCTKVRLSTEELSRLVGGLSRRHALAASDQEQLWDWIRDMTTREGDTWTVRREGLPVQDENGSPIDLWESALSRRNVQTLFNNLKLRRDELAALLREASGEWNDKDGFYRYYHTSFKTYYIQQWTLKIVEALDSLLPGTPRNGMFEAILKAGTGKTFDLSHNKDWDAHTRPMLEAYSHARQFLESAVWAADNLVSTEGCLHIQWALLLYYYNLR